MNCCVTELRCKEVINRETGNRIGPVCDIEVDASCGKVSALIVYGKPKFFGLFGRRDDIRICWENVEVIGDETVLVRHSECCTPATRRRMKGR